MRFPTPRPGDEIEAKHLQVIYDAIDEGPSVVAPLYVTSGGAIALGEQPGVWIQFTGPPSGTKHPWKQVLPQAGGGWVDGAASGTTTADPAREINSNANDLTDIRARAWRDRTSFEVRFAYSKCS